MLARFRLYNDYFGDMEFIGGFDTMDELNIAAFEVLYEAGGEFKPVILEYEPKTMMWKKYGGERNGK